MLVGRDAIQAYEVVLVVAVEGSPVPDLMVSELVLVLDTGPLVPVEQLPALEAAIEPFIHGVFQREQPWLVFSPHALAQHPGFLDVAF